MQKPSNQREKKQVIHSHRTHNPKKEIRQRAGVVQQHDKVRLHNQKKKK